MLVVGRCTEEKNYETFFDFTQKNISTDDPFLINGDPRFTYIPATNDDDQNRIVYNVSNDADSQKTNEG